MSEKAGINFVFSGTPIHKNLTFNIKINKPIKLIHKAYLIKLLFDVLVEYFTAAKDTAKKK